MTTRPLGVCVIVLATSVVLPAQRPPDPAAVAAPAPPAQPEAPADSLGRDTPRGTVLGFLAASRKRDDDLAVQYLDTRERAAAAAELARQLFVVLDARLPAKLPQLSDASEGSQANPLTPNQEVVGTVSSSSGPVDIVLHRVERPAGRIWLFSPATLQSVPGLFEEVTQDRGETVVGRWLTGAGLANRRVAQWLAVLLALVLIYVATAVANRLLTPIVRPLWRRVAGPSATGPRNVLPLPARLLVLAVAGRWLLVSLPLSLLVRQFWSTASSLLVVAAVVWLLMLLSERVEQYSVRRFSSSQGPAARSLLRVLRRAFDALVIFAGILAALRLFSVDLTPALAGLGVGGIAIALAAQKTLENVVAGASLIFDQALRTGDFLRVGNVLGTVEHIGLRSTRIRTLDRTLVTIPNSQIASASLETLSARDMFWFNHVVSLRFETTPDQLLAVVNGLRRMLDDEPSVDSRSVRVRFFRLGQFSFDVELFAYVVARDWNHFLEIQEQLLFAVRATVENAGAEIALPAQTMRVTDAQEQPAVRPGG
jgi:MscS family membrane protein